MSRFTIFALLASLALIAAACGGGGDDANTPDNGATDNGPSEIAAQVASSDLLVGLNRLSIGLFDAETNLILGAQVTLRLFKIDGDEETFVTELPAQYVALESNFVHKHEDGLPHTHAEGEIGLYIVSVEFDSAGIWAAEVTATIDGQEQEPVRAHFEVLAESDVPNIGDPAPRTLQLTLSDVTELSEIDTSFEPDPEMHELTIAAAIDSGKPVVVAFTTPAFCVSRICGPVKSEVVDPLFEEFQDEVLFVHVEPWDVVTARETGELVPVDALFEWSLQTEPWVFLIDAKGLIAARFEGIVSQGELREAIEAVLAG